MGFQLRSGISYCDVSDRLLFLDTHEDRYFGLQPAAEHAFRRLVADAVLDHPGREDLAGMLRSGTLIETPERQVPFPFRAPRSASLSLLDTEPQPVPPMRLLGVLASLMGARLSLRRRRLHQILKGIDLAKIPWPRTNLVDLDAIQAAASAFDMSSRFVRSHDKCLSRSIALARYLASSGLPADLIIGVKLRPFAAHCWVQSGNWLVNDRIDNVRPYTPIFAV